MVGAPGSIYCGRPSRGQEWRWGNPFRLQPHDKPGNAAKRFRVWLETGDPQGEPDATPERRAWMLSRLHELLGQKLACFCRDKQSCHTAVLRKLAERDHGATP